MTSLKRSKKKGIFAGGHGTLVTGRIIFAVGNCGTCNVKVLLANCLLEEGRRGVLCTQKRISLGGRGKGKQTHPQFVSRKFQTYTRVCILVILA